MHGYGFSTPIRVRFATEDKKLGPEQRFSVEQPRAIGFSQIDGQGGDEILTIENGSGRGRVLTLESSEEIEPHKRGKLIFYALPQGNERGRSLAVGDLDDRLNVVPRMVTDAGFTVVEIDQFYAPGAPKFASAFSVGVASA